LILGAGRSGTSMLSGCLYNAGYFMGDNLYSPNYSNPKGFFENAVINGVNEEIILETRRKNDSKIFTHQPLERGQMWLEVFKEGVKIYASRATEEKISKLLSHEGFCYKDPRFSYTLPIWMKYLKNMRFMVIFREPILTINSTIKECKQRKYLQSVVMNNKRALEIWLAMYRGILKLSKGNENWMFVHYNQLFKKEKLTEIEQFLQTEIDKDFPDPNLKRSKPEGVIFADADILYRELCDRAEFAGGERDFLPVKESVDGVTGIDYRKNNLDMLLRKKRKTPREIFNISKLLEETGRFKEAEIWLKKILRLKIDRAVLFEAYCKIGDLRGGDNRGSANKWYKKGLKLIDNSWEKRNLDLYRIGSLFKKDGQLQQAEEYYRLLLRKELSKSMKSGVYFHLGELCILQKRPVEAEHYLKLCLEWEKKHRKASEYLRELEKNG
jgi:tetratricopeptide (TPR) repeat protein